MQRPARTLLPLLVAGLASACSPASEPASTASSGGSVDHLDCAAALGGASRLTAEGRMAADEAVSERGLVAAMTHLNAYAIPRNISEKAAFDAVNAERDRLLAVEPPARIVTRAKACLEPIN